VRLLAIVALLALEMALQFALCGCVKRVVVTPPPTVSWLLTWKPMWAENYQVVRDGQVIATTTALSYVDTPPSGPHSYEIVGFNEAGGVVATSAPTNVVQVQ